MHCLQYLVALACLVATHICIALDTTTGDLADSSPHPPNTDVRTSNIVPRSDSIINLIATRISEVREIYLGADIHDLSITQIGDASTRIYRLQLLWQSPQAEWFLIRTHVWPDPTDSMTWTPPEKGLITKSAGEELSKETFDWGLVRVDMDKAYALAEGPGKTRGMFRQIDVYKPVPKMQGVISDIMYSFWSLHLASEHDYAVFVGAEAVGAEDGEALVRNICLQCVVRKNAWMRAVQGS